MSKNSKNKTKYKNKKYNNKNNYFNEEPINLKKVNQKIKIEKQTKNNFHSKKKQNQTEELLIQAFDPEENFPLPENYIIDELNEESVNFLKKAKEEEKFMEFSQSKQLFTEEKNQIFAKEDIFFNLNTNNKEIFDKNYTEFNISKDWKKIILHEFNYLNKFFTEAKANKSNYAFETLISAEAQKDYFTHLHLANLNKLNKQSLSHEELIKEFKLQKENFNNVHAPASDNMSLFLAIKLNNKNCIRLIKHLAKNLFEAPRNVYNILMWVYMLLSYIQLPLVDDDNSVLYAINKNVKNFIKTAIDNEKHINQIGQESDQNINPEGFGNNDESLVYRQQVNYDLISAKIIYIILSEFFNQRIIS